MKVFLVVVVSVLLLSACTDTTENRVQHMDSNANCLLELSRRITSCDFREDECGRLCREMAALIEKIAAKGDLFIDDLSYWLRAPAWQMGPGAVCFKASMLSRDVVVVNIDEAGRVVRAFTDVFYE